MTTYVVVTLSFFLTLSMIIGVSYNQEISINCGQCHSTGAKPTNIPDINKCFEGCHEPFTFLGQMHVVKQDPLRASFSAPGSECLDCHKIWTCTNCHRPHNPPTGTNCIRCHTANPSNFDHFGESSKHPPDGIDCTSCHNSHLTEVRMISIAGLKDIVVDDKSVVKEDPSSWMDDEGEYNVLQDKSNGFNGNGFNGNGFNGNGFNGNGQNGLEPNDWPNPDTYDDPERPYIPDEDLPWYLEIYESILIEPHEELVEVGVSTMFSDLLGVNVTIILIALNCIFRLSFKLFTSADCFAG